MRSVLEQSLPREQYEVVAVWPRDLTEEKASKLGLLKTINQFDKQVFGDFDDMPASEVMLLKQGVEKASGQLIYFIESHTPLYSKALEHILEHFNQNPNAVAAQGIRDDLHTTKLSEMLKMSNDAQFLLTEGTGAFTFGGDSIIRTDVFNGIDVKAERYSRHSEAVISHELKKITPIIKKIPYALSRHDDHVTIRQLIDITSNIGRGKYHFYTDYAQSGEVPRTFQKIMQGSVLSKCSLLFNIGAYFLLVLSILLLSLHKRIAFKVYLRGISFADFSGFTLERAKEKSKLIVSTRPQKAR
jgi:hypothetical protein